LLLLSSNHVALIFVPWLVLLVGWLAWQERNASILRRGAWTLALGLGLAAFFWLPALVERDLVHLHRVLENLLNYNNHFVYFQQLIDSPWGYGLSVSGLDDGMSFAIGIIHLAMAGLALLLAPQLRAASNRVWVMVSFAAVMAGLGAFFSLNTSAFLWERLPLLPFLQFPWRFHSLVALCAAFVCGFPFLLVAPEQKRMANGLSTILIGGLLLLNLPHAVPEKFLEVAESDYLPNNIAARYIADTTSNEYEPIQVNERPSTPATEPLTFLAGQGQFLDSRLSPTAREFVIEVTEAARLRLNTFYFPGWTLHVDGVERPIDYANPQGVMEFSLGPGQHGVKFVFGNTPIRLWSTWLSWLALLWLAAMPWVGRLRLPARLRWLNSS